MFQSTKNYIEESEGLDVFSTSYKTYGLHVNQDNHVIGKEWIPNARSVFLFGDFSKFCSQLYHDNVFKDLILICY